jgi:hypothetical protein
MEEADKNSEYNITLDELESGDAEGRTKMAFAKMQPPADLREKYQLTETDFALTDPSEESDREIEDANGADALKLTAGFDSSGDVGAAISPMTAPPTDDYGESMSPTSAKVLRGKSSKSIKSVKDDDRGNKSPKSKAKKKATSSFDKEDTDDIAIGDKAAQLGLYT